MYQDRFLNQCIHSYVKPCHHVLERKNVGNRFAVKKTGKSKSLKSMNLPLEWTWMLSSWKQCITSLTIYRLETLLIVEPVSRRSHLLLIPSDWAWRQALSWVCPSPELPGVLSAVPPVGQWSAMCDQRLLVPLSLSLLYKSPSFSSWVWCLRWLSKPVVLVGWATLHVRFMLLFLP